MFAREITNVEGLDSVLFCCIFLTRLFFNFCFLLYTVKTVILRDPSSGIVEVEII